MSSTTKISLLLALSLLAFGFASNENSAKKEEILTWVTHSDGSKQCEEKGEAISLKTAQAKLEKAGIKVFQGKSAMSDMMITTVCGAPTGRIHAFSIATKDLSKAENLGFDKSDKNFNQ